MCRLISAALIVAILIVLSITAGCTIPFSGDAPKQETPQTVNVGIRPITNPAKASFMQLDEALVSLKENVPGTSLDDRGNYKIYYIQGSGLDMTGRATRWMFGINSSTGSKLMISDYSGWSNIPWSARLPDNEIQIDKIISPTDLLKKNSITITPNPSEGASDYRELDLREGVYSITVTSAGSTRYLTFNAITGEPVVLQ